MEKQESFIVIILTSYLSSNYVKVFIEAKDIGSYGYYVYNKL